MVYQKAFSALTKRLKRTGICVFFLLVTAVHSFAMTDVAIYNDTAYQGGGAWEQGILAIKSMLDYHGYSYADIGPLQVNQFQDLNSLYRVIIVPGGWAGGYNQYMLAAGYQNIRTFVNNGGGYFGICAGSYFASNAILWQQDYVSPKEFYDYPLNLYRGIGVGPILSIISWTQSTGCSQDILAGAAMTTLTINTNLLPSISPSISILYYGGPAFLPDFNTPPMTNLSILARYYLPGTLVHNKPAMILFDYGQGRVFLSGPHPEISFENCTLYTDTDNWALMDAVLGFLME